MATEALQCTIDPEKFLENLASIRQLWEDEIPLDCLWFKCQECSEDISPNQNGVFVLHQEITTNMEIVVRQKEKAFLKEHITNSDKGCTGRKVGMCDIGLPTNLLFLFPCSDAKHLTPITVMNNEYMLDIMVTAEDQSRCFLALYTQEGSADTTYHEFLCANFATQLNVDHDEMEAFIMEDEDKVNRFRALLPRMEGKKIVN